MLAVIALMGQPIDLPASTSEPPAIVATSPQLEAASKHLPVASLSADPTIGGPQFSPLMVSPQPMPPSAVSPRSDAAKLAKPDASQAIAPSRSAQLPTSSDITAIPSLALQVNAQSPQFTSVVASASVARPSSITVPTDETQIATTPLLTPSETSSEPQASDTSVTTVDEPAPQESPANQQSTQDIFEEVFGRPQTSTPQQVVVPLIINGQPQGQILVIVPGGSQPTVQVVTDEFIAAIEDTVRSPIASQIAAFSQPDGTLDLQSIREVGIAVNFDSSRLELQVTVPPALRSTAVSSINEAQIPTAYAQALAPSSVSGYLNIRGSEAFVWSDVAGNAGRQPLALNFDGAINLEGWVLEGSLNFLEDREADWQRGTIRLVHDDVDSAIRYQLGDLALPVRGYQASVPMVGVSIARNFALQPYQITRPVSRFEFFLERGSTVEVFVNGRSVQTLRLEAGPQDVRNLPLNAGINGVQLVITDDLGRVQQLDFATGVSGDLLAPGVQQFAYSLGFPATGDSPGVAPQGYDFSQPTLTLSQRFGVTETFTIGGYLQGDFDAQVAGFEGTWATALGNFGWDTAVSHDRDHGVDVAARLYYDWLFQGSEKNTHQSLRLSAEYRGSQFMTLADETSNNATGLDVSLAYSQTVFDNTRMNLSGRYQFTRNQPSDAYSLSLGLSHPIGPEATLNANLRYGQTAQGEIQPQFFLGLSNGYTQQRQFVNASTQLDNNGLSNRLNWSYDAPMRLGGLNSTLTATTTTDGIDILSNIRFRGFRADVTLEHEFDAPRGLAGPSNQTTRITWGTAIAFADGVWGWSRPIDNSFALIARQGTAAHEIVQVNPSLDGPLAQADTLGPAVVPLSPYALTTLSVHAPDLELGSDLGGTSHTLLPTYRSGTLIRAGSEATVIARGRLLDDQGESLALQYGRILSLDDPDWPAAEVITNRTGRFVAAGLKPGRFEIWLFGHDAPIATFEIPAETTGIHDLGILGRPR